MPWVLDQTTDGPITARIDFEQANQAKTVQARETAKRATPSHFKLNQSLLETIRGELRSIQSAARSADTYESFQTVAEGHWKIDKAGYDEVRRLSGEDKQTTDGPPKGPTVTRFDKLTEGLVADLTRENLVQLASRTERPPERESSEFVVLQRPDAKSERVPKSRLSYASNEQHVSRLAKELAENFPDRLHATVADVIVQAIRLDPAQEKYQGIYVFDAAATKLALDKAEHTSPVVDKYKQGDVLVAAGAPITPEALAVLQREHESYMRARQTVPDLYRPWLYQRIGEAGVVLIITVGLGFYIRRFRPKVARHPTRTLSLAVLMLMMLLFTRAMSYQQWSPLWALVTTTTAAAILTIVYGERFAFGVTAGLAALTTLTLQADFPLFIIMLTVGGVLIFTLGDIRSRMRLIQVGVLTAGAAGASTFVVGLTEQNTLTFVSTQASIAAAAAMISCSFVLVMLPVIERMYGVATSMTLLEWADTSSPLLKQLVQKAPGTWQHSHLLGSMAEAAAEEIGANGLLVRVGAYYHDIGKMSKPEYFVENQQAQINAHSRLAPHMSLLVIVGHVKDGLALAEEYGLPKVLHAFLAEHHGTTLVRYFHHQAAARARSRDDRPVDEVEFRYPGPKPHSKETAILMLCDSVEGAVRAMPEPNPSRIEAIVHEIAMQRLMDGQLDECDMTLRELAKVEQSLVKSLCSIYHGRIAYPKAAAQPANTSPTPAPVPVRTTA